MPPAAPIRLGLSRFGFLINRRLGDFSQGFVRDFFLIKGFLKKRNRIIETQFLSPRSQCSVTRDFVVLDSLGCGDVTALRN